MEHLQTLIEGEGIIPMVTPVQQGLIVADICNRAKEEIERLQGEDNDLHLTCQNWPVCDTEGCGGGK